MLSEKREIETYEEVTGLGFGTYQYNKDLVQHFLWPSVACVTGFVMTNEKMKNPFNFDMIIMVIYIEINMPVSPDN